ncbi:MAG: ribosome biogenesis GTP-binding protein YihA/YsxC [Pseudomonadota bacterium]
MSQFPKARFLISAASPAQFVPDAGREVAFVGRSNAGKSSAINTIVNRRQFARTSKTPGRTQLVNFFELALEQRLVDLPGYGFAKVADAMRQNWERLIGDYFEGRDCIGGLFLIVDIRRGLGDGDRQILDLGEAYGLPLHVLLSKADKLKRGQAASTLQAARREVGKRATVQVFSALKRTGVDEARDVLGRYLTGE